MQKQKLPIKELLAIIFGELIISLIICGIYLIIDKFTYRVALGALFGSTVTTLNFLVLSILTNRVIDKVLAERGEGEMDEEAAAAFAAKHQNQVQGMIKLSYIIRTAVLAAALIVAILVDVFELIPTLIPLLMMRPIITVFEMIKRKRGMKNGS